jgi:hypothetical protein
MGLTIHLRNCCLHQSKNGIQVYLERVAPLGFRHLGNWRILRGPDAVIDDEDIQAAKGAYCGCYQGPAICGGAELLLYGHALVRAAALRGKGVGARTRLQIAESNARIGLVEEPDGGCADAARTSGDEGYLVFQ